MASMDLQSPVGGGLDPEELNKIFSEMTFHQRVDIEPLSHEVQQIILRHRTYKDPAVLNMLRQKIKNTIWEYDGQPLTEEKLERYLRPIFHKVPDLWLIDAQYLSVPRYAGRQNTEYTVATYMLCNNGNIFHLRGNAIWPNFDFIAAWRQSAWK